jgi:hypothetical protein
MTEALKLRHQLRDIDWDRFNSCLEEVLIINASQASSVVEPNEVRTSPEPSVSTLIKSRASFPHI